MSATLYLPQVGGRGKTKICNKTISKYGENPFPDISPANNKSQTTTKAMATHNLKTWMPFYQDVIDGRKTFELRKTLLQEL
ncbi:MAG: DUF3850 domain-containing protein [Nostoc sp. NMS7]|uniref:DUF3850 domain-containing protein n=1 Tax=Nostoc sp. NMS7 TaxID=2815391 RepID=UPI0025D28240|nr:DUF3850 domain-containing protein [Nostoc sp. NMS7]MBN3945257.1 DUF3850 domain-containing protein [Nostoc sp. NMS7]